MKKLVLALNVLFILSFATIVSANCGPGTSDPNCDKRNAQVKQEKVEKEQEERIIQLKKEGTYGKCGETSTPSKNVNNSSRKSGKAQEK